MTAYSEIGYRSVTTESGLEKDPRCWVRIVKPSEWAKVDVAALHIYKNTFSKSLKRTEMIVSVSKDLYS